MEKLSIFKLLLLYCLSQLLLNLIDLVCQKNILMVMIKDGGIADYDEETSFKDVEA